MKHYGDITKINGATVETVDVICGGSPCQDLSIAGKRAGLAGERSGLFMDQIRIIKEMRKNDELHCGRTNDTVRCRFMVWENVAGAFSSNNGEDFRAVLEETVRVIDKDACIPSIGNRKWPHAGCIMGTVDGTAYSVAWRLHDAQFWGVPQRRKRIALVADFGGTAAPEILFECESMSRDLEQGEQARKGTSDNSERSIGTSSAISFQERAGKPGGGKGILIQNERTGALSTLNNQYTCTCQNVAIGTDLYNTKITGDKAATLSAATGTSATHSEPTVLCVQGNAEQGQGCMIYKADGADGKGIAFSTVGDHENRPTDMTNIIIQRQEETREAEQQEAVFCEPYTSTKADFHARFTNDGKAQALTATDYKDAPCVAYGLDRASYNQGKNAKYGFSIDKEKIGAQTAMGPGAVFQSVVRRLTPKECERLQGFPDDWTNIGDWKDSKGKLHKGESDSPRYKALGNSIALPFWEWLAERIAKHLPQGATMASLFDGIGGFPLVFSRCGVRPVWASEIEEFPIAVTKKHFPEE